MRHQLAQSPALTSPVLIFLALCHWPSWQLKICIRDFGRPGPILLFFVEINCRNREIRATAVYRLPLTSGTGSRSGNVARRRELQRRHTWKPVAIFTSVTFSQFIFTLSRTTFARRPHGPGVLRPSISSQPQLLFQFLPGHRAGPLSPLLSMWVPQ